MTWYARHAGGPARGPAPRVAVVAFGVLLALAFGACGASPTGRTTTPRAPSGVDASSLAVRGNRLVDGSGHAVRLLGVNRSGTEYTCLQGGTPADVQEAVFSGPTDAATVRAMQAWHLNAVRLPLNEDCWLGINVGPGGVNPAAAGHVYEDAIAGYVRTLRAAGLYVILDLHWSAPGAFIARAQQPMADADHAPDFWRSVAQRFAGDRGVIFDLYNEPNLGGDVVQDPAQDRWACWRDGCPLTMRRTGAQPATAPYAWQAAGMQALVDAVRAAGARNVILLGGLNFAGDLSNWLAYLPHDPAGQLAASWHVYPGQSCAALDCWQREVAPVGERAPVVIGETGDHVCAAPALVPHLLDWADGQGLSYLGWSWNPWDGCDNVLIRDWGGTPTANYGQAFHDHVARAAMVGDAAAATSAASPTAAAQPGPSPALWLGLALVALGLGVLLVPEIGALRRRARQTAGAPRGRPGRPPA